MAPRKLVPPGRMGVARPSACVAGLLLATPPHTVVRGGSRPSARSDAPRLVDPGFHEAPTAGPSTGLLRPTRGARRPGRQSPPAAPRPAERRHSRPITARGRCDCRRRRPSRRFGGPGLVVHPRTMPHRDAEGRFPGGRLGRRPGGASTGHSRPVLNALCGVQGPRASQMQDQRIIAKRLRPCAWAIRCCSTGAPTARPLRRHRDRRRACHARRRLAGPPRWWRCTTEYVPAVFGLGYTEDPKARRRG